MSFVINITIFKIATLFYLFAMVFYLAHLQFRHKAVGNFATGLTALGLGLGVTGGLGVCLLLGLASYTGVRWLLRSRPAPSRP